MEKLTDSQIDKLALLLSYQFKGLTILKGNSYGYNEGFIFIGTPYYVIERSEINYKDTKKIENKIFSNAVSNLKVWNRLDLGFNNIYTPLILNVEKLMTYSNGQLVINKALELLSK
ncbi:MAG: hypothetical protein ACO239_05840 [Sediminibacterium sp.]